MPVFKCVMARLAFLAGDAHGEALRHRGSVGGVAAPGAVLAVPAAGAVLNSEGKLWVEKESGLDLDTFLGELTACRKDLETC